MNRTEIDLSPRGQCLEFMVGQGAEPLLVSKVKFDNYVEQGNFETGPFRDTYGDGYGDAYNPYRQAFGRLKDGSCVYCELHPDLQEEVRRRLSEDKTETK